MPERMFRMKGSSGIKGEHQELVNRKDFFFPFKVSKICMTEKRLMGFSVYEEVIRNNCKGQWKDPCGCNSSTFYMKWNKIGYNYTEKVRLDIYTVISRATANNRTEQKIHSQKANR